MINKQYIVKDSLGNTIRVFNSYQQADTWILAYGNYKYTITTKNY